MKLTASFLISALLALSSALSITERTSWSCTVPSGYTYDQVVNVVGTCGPGTNPYYHVLLPQDGLWACLQVTGYIYDRVNSSTSCSPAGISTIQYRLRTPVDGLMACGPGTWNGFVFDFTLPTTLCTLTGEAQMYHLRAPVDGLWSCAQLTGFVYDEVELSAECTVGGSQAPLYHLKKPVDGLWACGPGTYNGFTYDNIRAGTGTTGYTCVIGNVAAPSYHLRQPLSGLWACAVPSGWAYSQTREGTGCLVGTQATQYLLK